MSMKVSPIFKRNVFQYKVLFYNAKWNRNIPRSRNDVYNIM